MCTWGASCHQFHHVGLDRLLYLYDSIFMRLLEPDKVGRIKGGRRSTNYSLSTAEMTSTWQLISRSSLPYHNEFALSQIIMDPQEDVVPTEPLFRPAKKRKFMRRRLDPELADTEEADNQNDNTSASQVPGSNNIRRPRAVRKGGIGFSTASRLGDDQGQQALVPTVGETEDEKIRAMNERFTGYTGQTVDVDKHMYGSFPTTTRPVRLMWANEIRMAFIDSEMAKRYQPKSTVDNSGSNQSTQAEVAGGLSVSGHQTREPASLGKLHEIDLGQEATLRNIARTEAATRRMAEKGELPASVDHATSETGRPGPDDKSWRNRNQRTEADIARDRLVEEVLRESKCASTPKMKAFKIFVFAN